jgi:hypothetical protein
VLSWLEPESQSSPVVLVHGVFGAGKSHLLVVLVLVLSRILDQAGDKATRIVIAAATNTAVDRVLLGLLQHKYSDFLRVGSLRKIAKPILGHMLDISPPAQRIAELQRMLKSEDLSACDRFFVQKELEQQKAGHHQVLSAFVSVCLLSRTDSRRAAADCEDPWRY